MPKWKCKFNEELNTKFQCFKNGRDDWEAECTVCKPGTFVSVCKPGTFVSVANKGIADLKAHVETEMHKRAIRGESFSQKLTNYFVRVGSKSEEEVSIAEGIFAFHTVKHHNSYKSMDCTSVLLKNTFPDWSSSKIFEC